MARSAETRFRQPTVVLRAPGGNETTRNRSAGPVIPASRDRQQGKTRRNQLWEPRNRRRARPTEPSGAQICEYPTGRRKKLVMFVTISASVYPGVVLNFFHSGSETNVRQAASRAAMSSNTNM